MLKHASRFLLSVCFVVLLLALILWLLVKHMGRRYREGREALRRDAQSPHLTMQGIVGSLSEPDSGLRDKGDHPLLKQVYWSLAARFHDAGYRVEQSGPQGWVLVKEYSESLRAFSFSMTEKDTDILCDAGVCFRPVDELLEPVFIPHEVARRYPASCTFRCLYDEKAFGECWVASTGTAEQVAERVWTAWTRLQPWFEDHSDLRKAALNLEATAACLPFPYSRVFAKLIAAYHHLGDQAEELRCLEAMVHDSLRCDPADLGDDAPSNALDLLEHLRWANLHLGLELPPPEPVHAWCRRCIELNPEKAAQLSFKARPNSEERIGFQQLLPGL